MKDKEEFFTIRLWQEALTEKQAEWRGKIQHIGSGDASYFRDLTKMMDFITCRLSGLANNEHPQDAEALNNDRLLKSGSLIPPGKNQAEDSESGELPHQKPVSYSTPAQSQQKGSDGFIRHVLWKLEGGPISSKVSRFEILRGIGIIVIGVVIFIFGLNQFNPIDPKTTGMVFGSKPLLVGLAGFFQKLRLHKQKKASDEEIWQSVTDHSSQ